VHVSSSNLQFFSIFFFFLFECLQNIPRTPWLTTRRRTCPICKGDVVRSLTHGRTAISQSDSDPDSTDDDVQMHSEETRDESPTPVMRISRDLNSDIETDLERGGGSASAPQETRPAGSNGWRELLVSSLSAIPGDWRVARSSAHHQQQQRHQQQDRTR
jgi:hypothetical protein